MIIQTLERTYCPYCGEHIELLIDTSITEQEYVEDCEVCCRPIVVSCTVSQGFSEEVLVSLRREDD
ncbi:MAG: hypothetical protein CMQ45_08490 [Gammaproteobacteria bacterium]|nr:hypothetical protein [Gammaproteobacteria bacterium]